MLCVGLGAVWVVCAGANVRMRPARAAAILIDSNVFRIRGFMRASLLQFHCVQGAKKERVTERYSFKMEGVGRGLGLVSDQKNARESLP